MLFSIMFIHIVSRARVFFLFKAEPYSTLCMDHIDCQSAFDHHTRAMCGINKKKTEEKWVID